MSLLTWIVLELVKFYFTYYVYILNFFTIFFVIVIMTTSIDTKINIIFNEIYNICKNIITNIELFKKFYKNPGSQTFKSLLKLGYTTCFSIYVMLKNIINL